MCVWGGGGGGAQRHRQPHTDNHRSALEKFIYYMAHGSVHKMVRSDWLVAGPYFRVRTREMDPVRWTAPNNLCRKLRSCMSDSGCVILTEPEESYKNILRKSTLWHPFCKTTAKSTEEVS